jgi:hypothetical protein
MMSCFIINNWLKAHSNHNELNHVKGCSIIISKEVTDIKRTHIFMIMMATLVMFTLLFTSIYHLNKPDDSKVKLQQSPLLDTPIVRVRLLNYLGNVNELTIDLVGSHRINQETTHVNKSYRLKLESGKLILIDGISKLLEGTTNKRKSLSTE